MIQEDKTNYLFILLAFMIFGFYLAGISTAVSEDNKDEGAKGNKIVARVNGHPIYENALIPRTQQELKKYRKYGAGRDTSSLEKRLKRRVLDEVIEMELIKQESRKLQLENMDGKVEAKLRELRSRYKSEDDFSDFLKTSGRTEKDVKASVKSNILFEEYLKMKGIRDPKVSEEEARKYYEENKENFRGMETIHASHILIMVKEDAKPEEQEPLLAKAGRIRTEILDGKEFTEAAIEYSEDKKTDLGYIERGFMPAEFDRVAFSMKEGELSEVVRTKHGYHIIKVHDRKPEGIVPFEDVRDFISKYLQEGLARQNRESHIKELKSRAEIEILLNGS